MLEIKNVMRYEDVDRNHLQNTSYANNHTRKHMFGKQIAHSIKCVLCSTAALAAKRVLLSYNAHHFMALPALAR